MIEVTGLTKRFSRHEKIGRFRRRAVELTAVDRLTFSVAEGGVVGYLGQNGSGKSTTIKLLTGILAPSEGRLVVAGREPLRERRALAASIGVVFGQRSQLWWDLPLADSFDLLHHIYRTSAAAHRRRLGQLSEQFDVGRLLAVPVRQLSLGQRMRGELVAALLHEPRLVFLDEPTIGLDVVSKHAVREALADLNTRSGVTIVLTTHDLADVERLCRRLLIIDAGRLVWDGDIDDLLVRHGAQRRLVVDLAEPAAALEVAGASCERIDGPRQWLLLDGTHSAADVLAAVSTQAAIRDLSIEEPAIEEVVRRIYEAAPGHLMEQGNTGG